MDPISIVGLAGTALGVLGPLAKSLSFLLQLSTKYKMADAKMTLLIGFLASVQVSVHEIANIIKSNGTQPQHSEVAESLNTTLDCTTFSLSILQAKIDALGLDSVQDMTKLEKAIVLFKGAEFDEYLTGLDTYVNALNLLLNVLQT